MVKNSVKIGKNTISFFESGNFDQTILLVNELGESAENWLKILPGFEKSYRVIAPDLMRLDYHDMSLADYSLEFFVDILQKFIKEIKIGKLSIVGSGFGGRVAAEFASENRNLLEKLILVSPANMMKQSTPALDAYIMAALYPRETPDEKILDKLCDVPFSTKKLQSITVPTLIIWGSDDPVIPIQHSEEFVSSIKDCRFYIMDDCGHTPYVQNPAIFVSAVMNFLK